MDTVFARATAAGRAGVAVIRVSGPLAASAIEQLAGAVPPARMATLKVLRAADGRRLDQALVLWFEDGASFTGEAVAEFHLHGSIAVVSAVLDELAGIDGLRPAEPGEFTRQALENQRLDLAQVEGLADLIEAETEAQRRQAMRLMSGDLSDLAEGWRRDLIRAAALLEATIDFADEDVPVDVGPEVRELLDKVIPELTHQADGVGIAERVRHGFEVAIVGAPNVGKSTLLNALAGRDAAITSEFAGTTRDVIEVRMDLGGLPVTLLDTAGLRDSDDHVESIGIERAKDRARAADLRVFLGDGAPDAGLKPGPDDIVLKPKADLLEDKAGAISGVSGEGIPELIEAIRARLSGQTAGIGLATRERHRDALNRAALSLDTARESLENGADKVDIAAEELRTGIRALEMLVGRIDVEALLDEIFASFCLGK